jgi:hypothetical protein
MGTHQVDAHGTSNSNVGSVVCSLTFQISVDSLGAFEKLIEAYGKLADMLPRFDRLGTALSHDHNFQALLALVYTDILEFHRRAYKFVRRKCMFDRYLLNISNWG